jgi:hypothetical protein
MFRNPNYIPHKKLQIFFCNGFLGKHILTQEIFYISKYESKTFLLSFHQTAENPNLIVLSFIVNFTPLTKK